MPRALEDVMDLAAVGHRESRKEKMTPAPASSQGLGQSTRTPNSFATSAGWCGPFVEVPLKVYTCYVA